MSTHRSRGRLLPGPQTGLALLAGLLAGGDAAAPSRADPARRPLDAFFRAASVAVDGALVTLRYDFGSEEQLKDFDEFVPWRIERLPDQRIAWFDERLEVKGNAGARHRADWEGDVLVSCTLMPDSDKDLGGWVAPAGGEDDYASYTLAETYFHRWDRNPGGNNAIIKFGPQWREAGSANDFVGFRYVSRRPAKPPLKPGVEQELAFGVEKGQLVLRTMGMDLKGKDPGRRFREVRVGLYAIKGRMLVDDLVISGRLTDAFLQREGLALEVGGRSGRRSAAEVAALAEGYAAGTTPAADLAAVVGDAGAPAASRRAAADALATGPKAGVRAVVDLLYRADLESRSLGIEVVRRLLGRDYGYNPKGPEPARRAAVRKLNDEIRDDASLLQGG